MKLIYNIDEAIIKAQILANQTKQNTVVRKGEKGFSIYNESDLQAIRKNDMVFKFRQPKNNNIQRNKKGTKNEPSTKKIQNTKKPEALDKVK